MRVRNFVMLRVTATLAKVFHVWLFWKGHWLVLIFQKWRSWARGKTEMRGRKEYERRVEIKLRQKFKSNPALQMRCLRCVIAATSIRYWRAFGGWRRGVANVQKERACRRCIAVWAPDCHRQLIRFHAWRRGMRNQQRREALVAHGNAVCRQIRFRLVLLGLRTTTVRQRHLRVIVAQLRDRRFHRCAASVVASWRYAVVSQRRRLVNFERNRTTRIVGYMFRALYVATVTRVCEVAVTAPWEQGDILTRMVAAAHKAEQHRRTTLLRLVLHAAMDFTVATLMEQRLLRRWAKIGRRLKLVVYIGMMQTAQAKKDARVAKAQNLMMGTPIGGASASASGLPSNKAMPTFVLGRNSLKGVFEQVMEKNRKHYPGQGASTAKSRWGRVSSQRRAQAEQKKKERFQAVVRELAQAKQQEAILQAEAEAAASALKETLAAEQQAGEATSAAEQWQQTAEAAAKVASAALADADEYEAEVETRFEQELAAAEAELAAAGDARARGCAEARITRCRVVREEEQRAAGKAREELERAKTAADANLSATEQDLSQCRQNQADVLRRKCELLERVAQTKHKVAEAHTSVEKAESELTITREESTVEPGVDGAEETGPDDGQAALTLREMIARVKSDKTMREGLNLPSICSENEAEALDNVLANSDVADSAVDFESFCATIALVAETVPQLGHLRAATQWARPPTCAGFPQSAGDHDVPGIYGKSKGAKFRWRKVSAHHETKLQEKARRQEAFRRMVNGLSHAKATELAAQTALEAADNELAAAVAAEQAALASGDLKRQAAVAANLQRLEAEHEDAEHKLEDAHRSRRLAERDLEKAKAEDPGSEGADIWANVMNVRHLSMRFKAWTKHHQLEKMKEDKLVALFHDHADKRWIPLKVFRAWYRIYQRADIMRTQVRLRNENQRAKCFCDWWNEHRARNLRRHQRDRWLAASIHAWSVAAVSRRKRRVSADAVEKLKRRRLMVAWRKVSRALRLYRHSLEALGFATLRHNRSLQELRRRVLAAWSKRARAQCMSREAASCWFAKRQDAAWSAWLKFHRLMEKLRIVRKATVRRRLTKGWDGWKYLQRLAGRLTPPMLLASSTSLCAPRRRKSAIWTIWSSYVRTKHQWRKEKLRSWTRDKLLERHLACGKRRKSMVCFVYWKHLYVNKLHNVGARTCAAHGRLTRCLQAWNSWLESTIAERTAVSRAVAQHLRTVRTIVLYALHRCSISRRALRRAACRAEQIHRSRVGGSVLRGLHACTTAWRTNRAVGCFTSWAELTGAMEISRKHTRTRIRALLGEILTVWSSWSVLVSGRFAAQVGMASVFAHWARHVRCLRNARQRQEWAQSALALMPGGSGLGGNSTALTEGLLEELALVRAIAAFRDRLVGRRVLRALNWYASKCRYWRVVVRLLVSSLRGVAGVFVRCRLLAWQAWASRSRMERSAGEASDAAAKQWRERRWYAAVFKTWRELATAAGMRRLRAQQLGRVRAGASRRQLGQTIWFEWSAAFYRRRIARTRGRTAQARLLHAVVSAWRSQVVCLQQEAAQLHDVVKFDRTHRTADAFVRWAVFALSEARPQPAFPVDTGATIGSPQEVDQAGRVDTRILANGSTLARHSVPRLHNRARHSSVTPATPRTPFHHGRFPGRIRVAGVPSTVGTCVGTPLAASRAVIARYSTPRRGTSRNISGGGEYLGPEVTGILFE